MKDSLFGPDEPEILSVDRDIWCLRGFCEPERLAPLVEQVVSEAPWRHMTTMRGHRIQVAMSNCGDLGWVSDRRGYRYSSADPESGKPWPVLPKDFASLAGDAAAAVGFRHFEPDACLINRYSAGQGMGSHQDRNEKDMNQPIVSVSLGLPARFFLRGDQNKGKSTAVDLSSGDILVWGASARLVYHGVRPLKPGADPLFGPHRINLTFRKAG